MSSTALDAKPLPAPIVYPQRDDRAEPWIERLGTTIEGYVLGRLEPLRQRTCTKFTDCVGALAEEHAAMSDAALVNTARRLGVELRRQGFRDPLATRAFALIREVATRTVGMDHFDVQVMGGYAMLRGMLAEMETGEGKTLTATLPACTAVLAGKPVHIVTVNDYLARRDADTMGPIYDFLGLTVGVTTEGMDEAARRAAYRSDVVYCTNKVLAFDHLRDRIVLGNQARNLRLKLEQLYSQDGRVGKLLLRGLGFAIVDEADSVLVDEARTPLIISGRSEGEQDQRLAEQALALADELDEGLDFRVLRDERRIELSGDGKARLKELADPLGGIWRARVFREEAAVNALSARRLFVRDEHYLARDGKVQIIDEYTGRVMPDRHWGEGLQQMIEAKEDCEVSRRIVPIARITYQRFFRRYKHLAGMTGTAREVSGELWSVYRLAVMRIPTNRPAQRSRRPDHILATATEKWRAIAAAVAAMHQAGRPVLIGTRSVAASETASERLTKAGLDHEVLNAAQDENEAAIIARAGEHGRITIATNMAGRGTDIQLGDGVAARSAACK